MFNCVHTRFWSLAMPLLNRSLSAGCLCALTACAGITEGAVRDTTSAITAQVALAKASLVLCRGGDRAQCDDAEKNLNAIASANAQLDQLTEP